MTDLTDITRPREPERRIVIRREPFTLGRSPWSVTIEPRVVTFPTQWAKDKASAVRIAHEMSAARGWPVDDRTSDRQVGQR